MKKIKNYIPYMIIAIVMLVIGVILFNDTNLKKEHLCIELIIAAIIEIVGVTWLKRLLKQNHPATILTMVGLTFLMFTPIFSIVWLLTYSINDWFLLAAIYAFLLF